MQNRDRNNERERWSQSNRGTDYGRQQEQFDSNPSMQYDGSTSYDQEFGRVGQGNQRNFDQSAEPGFRDRSYRSSGSQSLDDYDRASYEMRSRRQTQPGMHASFRGDSYGGEAMSGPNTGIGAGSAYGYSSSSGSGFYGSGGYSGSYSDNRGKHDRGFFDRAGDEIASWFGDEEAERRREKDHRGSGPANYTRSNERTLEIACERLTEDRGVDASNVNVTCENNELTLDGTVNTRWEKRRAEDCVHDISGVKHVQNNLRIAQPEMRAGQMQESIES